MLDSIWKTITDQLHSNAFLSGGAVLMAMGALMHQCRKTPAALWNWLVRLAMIQVDIPDRDPAFYWINDWLATHPYGARRARFLTVRTVQDDNQESEASGATPSVKSRRPRIIFAPAPGHHYFFYRGRLVVLHRERTDVNNANSVMTAIRETFTLRVFTRNRDIVRQLIEDACEAVYPTGDNRVVIRTGKYSNWHIATRSRPRPLDSVVLDQGVMEELVNTITHFRSSEDWYIGRGLPYRLGVLLKGPPGSGKTSAVMAIASHFRMDIAILTLSARNLDDDDLRNLLLEAPKNSIILLEDVDCVFDHREATDDNAGVTFSGLLNAIDGVGSGDGRIFFMTTNCAEKLDPALVRPGRADLHLHLGWPTASQVCRIFERFYPDATPCQTLQFVESVPEGASMAGLQFHLSHYQTPNVAIDNARKMR